MEQVTFAEWSTRGRSGGRGGLFLAGGRDVVPKAGRGRSRVRSDSLRPLRVRVESVSVMCIYRTRSIVTRGPHHRGSSQDGMNGFPCMFPIDMGEPYATAPTPVSWSRVTNVGGGPLFDGVSGRRGKHPPRRGASLGADTTRRNDP